MNVGTTPVLHTPPPPDSREVNYENTDRYKDGYPGKVKVSVSVPQTCHQEGSPSVSQGGPIRVTRGPKTCNKGSQNV